MDRSDGCGLAFDGEWLSRDRSFQGRAFASEMRKPDDFSSEHFDWLVEGRSQNQRSTLSLYRIIEVHEQVIRHNVVFHSLAQELTTVAFSLWRAVFLSDLTGDFGDRLTDLKKFLQSLIAHNTVLYQTDFTTREWTFQYYLDNAVFRLAAIVRMDASILPKSKVDTAVLLAKDDWINAQNALDLAIANFAGLIGSPDPKPP